MLKFVSKQYGLPDRWNFRPPAGIRLVDIRTIEELDQHAAGWNELYSQAGRLTPMLSYPWMRAFFRNQVAAPERWLRLFAYENDGYPNLCFDGVFAGSKKHLDTQMLLDPFEEEFDLPASLVDIGHAQSR